MGVGLLSLCNQLLGDNDVVPLLRGVVACIVVSSGALVGVLRQPFAVRRIGRPSRLHSIDQPGDGWDLSNPAWMALGSSAAAAQARMERGNHRNRRHGGDN